MNTDTVKSQKKAKFFGRLPPTYIPFKIPLHSYITCWTLLELFWFFFSLFNILTVKVNTDTGKVEIILTKEWEKQWSSVGKHLGKHNKTVKLKDQGNKTCWFFNNIPGTVNSSLIFIENQFPWILLLSWFTKFKVLLKCSF